MAGALRAAVAESADTDGWTFSQSAHAMSPHKETMSKYGHSRLGDGWGFTLGVFIIGSSSEAVGQVMRTCRGNGGSEALERISHLLDSGA